MSAIIATVCCGPEPAPTPLFCGQRSGADGGYSFVHSPDISITRKPVIWHREDTTRIISLTDALRGFADLRSLDFEAMGRILFDSEDDAGCSVIVTGSFGIFSFLLDDPAAQKRPAVVIPIDLHYRNCWYALGHAAYSVAKGAVKVLTEQLAHELLVSTGGSVSAHLLVPGYACHGKDGPHDRKPEAAWTAEQVVDYFLQRIFTEDFYILCPDNEVTSEMDVRRIQWSADDMIHNRPALSRWHPAWAQKFTQWMREV